MPVSSYKENKKINPIYEYDWNFLISTPDLFDQLSCGAYQTSFGNVSLTKLVNIEQKRPIPRTKFIQIQIWGRTNLHTGICVSVQPLKIRNYPFEIVEMKYRTSLALLYVFNGFYRPFVTILIW